MATHKRPYTYFTRFRLEGQIGGGGRRALQIIHDFKEDELLCIPAIGYELWDWSSLIKRLSYRKDIIGFMATCFEKCLPYLIFGLDYFKWSPCGRRPFLWFWRLSQNWKRETRHLCAGDIVLIDDPYYFRHLVSHLKRRNIQLVGVAHNLETLFESYCKDKYRLHLMNKELAVLRKCDLVITISREENCLLTNNGVNAAFHKYYPTKGIENTLLKIRQARQRSTKDFFILLGNAANPETRKGMAELADIWKENIPNQRLYIIGYHTNLLEQSSNNKNVVLLGPLTNDELSNMLVKATAVITYQRRGPGSLTKIAEMLLASIPVIGNFHALRTYYGLNGVFQFDTIQEFKTVVNVVSTKNLAIDFSYERPLGLKAKIDRMIYS